VLRPVQDSSNAIAYRHVRVSKDGSSLDIETDISESEISDALQRVLASKAFARSERSRALLAYLVEQTIAGQSDLLKAYAIGQDVFGRDCDFDPQQDSVVRVQARRMRDALDVYYSGEGAGDRIRISVPVGSYEPDFTRVSALGATLETGQAASLMAPYKSIPEEGSAALSLPVSSFVVRNIRLFWVALGVIVGLLVILIFAEFRGDRDVRRTVDAAGAPVLTGLASDLSLPIIVVSDTTPTDQPSMHELVGRLRGSVANFPSSQAASQEAARSGRTAGRYIFDLTVERAENGFARLSLSYRQSGLLVWAGNIAIEPSGAQDGQTLAGVLTMLLPPGGTMYGYISGIRTMSPLMRCLNLTEAYFRQQNEAGLNEAFACHQALKTDHDNHPLINADLSSLIVAANRREYAVAQDYTIKDAITLAAAAVDRRPDNSSALRSYANALNADGQTIQALEAMTTAVERNPDNLNLTASLGFLRFEAGDFIGAQTTMASAIAKTDRAAEWWYYTLFSAAMVNNNDRVAIEAARSMTTSNASHYIAARVIGAHLAGNHEQRDEFVAQLATKETRFARDPARFYSERLPEETADRLVRLLEKAGYTPSG